MADVLWSEVQKSARKNIAALVFNSELNFDHQIYTIAQKIYEKSKIKLILMAGPSASGKTTSCNLLAERLEFLGIKTHVMSTDDFFIDRDKTPKLPNGLYDFDSICTIDVCALQLTLGKLLKGQSVQLPRFDFVKGKSYPDGRIIDVNDGEDIVILEGIHALNPLLMAGFDYQPDEVCRISIAPRRGVKMSGGRVVTPDDIRLIRRTLRDHYTRGYTPDETAAQWPEVLNAEKKNIYPYFYNVDYEIDSVHEYELILYKLCLGGILNDAYSDIFDNIKAAMKEVVTMPISAIPTTSLLNEFAAFGKFARE